MIRKLKSGKYRLYSRKKDPKTGKRRILGTFDTKEEAKQHEREIQYSTLRRSEQPANRKKPSEMRSLGVSERKRLERQLI